MSLERAIEHLHSYDEVLGWLNDDDSPLSWGEARQRLVDRGWKLEEWGVESWDAYMQASIINGLRSHLLLCRHTGELIRQKEVATTQDKEG